jgi:hypothetical protein
MFHPIRHFAGNLLMEPCRSAIVRWPAETLLVENVARENDGCGLTG